MGIEWIVNDLSKDQGLYGQVGHLLETESSPGSDRELDVFVRGREACSVSRLVGFRAVPSNVLPLRKILESVGYEIVTVIS